MRLAHIAVATPRRCGLYETTHELVVAERAMGHDARIVDPKPVKRFAPGPRDRGVPVETKWGFAVKADVVVSHSGHDGTPVAETRQPIVHVQHGRPISVFMRERANGSTGYSYCVARAPDPRYRSVVTFWSEHAPILRQLWAPKPVRTVPAPVDLDYWRPGETDYDFGGKRGTVNVVVTDPWHRADACPIAMVHAFMLFRHLVPGARLHLYAVDKPKGLAAVQKVLGPAMGVIQGWAADLRPVYQAADMVITPNRIYTRSIREAMACGCQVVSGIDHEPEDAEGFAVAMLDRIENPEPARKLAEAWFDPGQTAARFLAVAEEAASGD